MILKLDQKLSRLTQRYNIPLSRIIRIYLVFFLLAIFDGILVFLTPIVIVNSGLTESQMGLIYSTSSLFGIGFDILLTRLLSTTSYKKLLLYTALIIMLFPLSLLLGKQIIFFLSAMMFWSLYTNLWNFAFYDFSARESKSAFHASSLAIIYIFNDVGYTISSLFAEDLSKVTSKWIQLGILAVFPIIVLLLLLSIKDNKKKIPQVVEHDMKIPLKEEIFRVNGVFKRLFPLLLLTFTMTVIEAITLLITPLIEHITSNFNGFAGLAMAAYFIPSIFVPLILDKYIVKFGKKRTAIFSFILGSICLLLQGLFEIPIIYLLLSFFASFFYSIFYAGLGGAFADYLEESKRLDNEILGVKDVIANFAYFVGPILGGVLMQLVNSIILFTYIGIAAIVISIVSLLLTPKEIDFHDNAIIK